ncbi:MAG: MoaD/ThiS family protein [Dehalococcoidia bacterium]|nr:MAG: MoaD/ThiS family protein [Dehalococcoidia bacterium]
MKVGIEEIEVTESKTVMELMDELQLPPTPFLLEVGGEVFYPDEIKDRRLEKGDKVAIIPVIAGG